MKFSMLWLSEHLNIKKSEWEKIIQKLPEIGIEVDSVEKTAGDTIVEIEITPNRGDLLSVHGIARDVGALLGRKAKRSSIAKLPKKKSTVGVKIVPKTPCKRYLGAVIEGVTVKASPKWLKERIESSGHAQISNIVDVTNYVLAEFGQPLHAFDVAKLNGNIQVRNAKKKEKINALDQNKYVLDGDMVIADNSGPVALAGVIGGVESSVTEKTKTIFLECALFEPGVVRGTSRKLGVTTDSSFRFERGVDPVGMEDAFRYAISLITKVAGGKLVGWVDVGKSPTKPKPISLDGSDVSDLLGVDIPVATSKKILSNLGCAVSGSGQKLKITAPSYRPDISIKEDLIEEVARIWGMDKIPARMPVSNPANPEKADALLLSTVRTAALRNRLTETVHMSFVSEENIKVLGGDINNAVAISNPLSGVVSHLSNSLLHGLLETASLNLRRGRSGVRLFEIGTVFALSAKSLKESSSIGLLLCGIPTNPHFSQKEEQSPFMCDLKAIVEDIIIATRRFGVVVYEHDNNYSGYDQRSSINVGGVIIGHLGSLSKSALNTHEISKEVLVAEINLQKLLKVEARGRKYKELPKYPSIKRDLSLVLKMGVDAEEVRAVVHSAGVSDLVDYYVFDLFCKPDQEPKTYTLGITMVFQSESKTLSDDEVNKSRDTVFNCLADKLGAKLP